MLQLFGVPLFSKYQISLKIFWDNKICVGLSLLQTRVQNFFHCKINAQKHTQTQQNKINFAYYFNNSISQHLLSNFHSAYKVVPIYFPVCTNDLIVGLVFSYICRYLRNGALSKKYLINVVKESLATQLMPKTLLKLLTTTLRWKQWLIYEIPSFEK